MTSCFFPLGQECVNVCRYTSNRLSFRSPKVCIVYIINLNICTLYNVHICYIGAICKWIVAAELKAGVNLYAVFYILIKFMSLSAKLESQVMVIHPTNSNRCNKQEQWACLEPVHLPPFLRDNFCVVKFSFLTIMICTVWRKTFVYLIVHDSKGSYSKFWRGIYLSYGEKHWMLLFFPLNAVCNDMYFV